MLCCVTRLLMLDYSVDSNKLEYLLRSEEVVLRVATTARPHTSSLMQVSRCNFRVCLRTLPIHGMV